MNNFPVSQISNNPALVLSHFNEIIERRKAALFPEGAHDGVTEVLLLDRRDRPLYLASQVDVTQQEIEASYCERGITTTAHLREFIQLVHEISAACSTIAASELRSYHLDLLRAMRDEMVQKRA
ncbi:hypothetical protein [Pseudomonas sp. G5(2012)]|uniref:hypothetical protein n=1 Tax=Pseudomonas sp. G5(2012) TaxID=1268068 RepID=UPI0003431F35|nr:hypothetical protein [Pseudomonas sp. G5(2012)]EPA94780.1 hypothetical protein PG5_47310 [Pseudomonas sp. G5(2012)]